MKYLEIVIKSEVATLNLGFGSGLLNVLLGGAGHDTGLLVVTDALLEEVGLAAKGNVLHEVEGVSRLVHLVVTESNQKTVGNKLDILLHKVGVHAQHGARKSLGQELLLNGDGVSDDALNDLLACAIV